MHAGTWLFAARTIIMFRSKYKEFRGMIPLPKQRVLFIAAPEVVNFTKGSIAFSITLKRNSDAMPPVYGNLRQEARGFWCECCLLSP